MEEPRENHFFDLPTALPALDGRLRWPFIVLWSALLVVCVVSFGGSLIANIQTISAPLAPHEIVGLLPDEEVDWPTIGAVGPMARLAGIRRGDKLISIDGIAVPSDPVAIEKALEGPTGSVAVLGVSSRDGRSAFYRLTRDPLAARQELNRAYLSRPLYTALRLVIRYLCYDVLLLVCAVLLMVRRWHDRLAPWTSLMMLVFVLGYGLSGVWLSMAVSGSYAVYDAINGIGSGLLLVVLAVFPTGRFEPRWSFAVAVVGGTTQLWLNYFLSGPESNALLFASQCLAVAAIVARYRCMPPGTGRQQIRWAVLGFAVSTLALLIGALFQAAGERAPTIAGHDWLILADSLFFGLCTALLALGLTISLLRYRLYDADVTISRSLVFGSLTLGLLAVFAGSEKLVELLGEQYLGERLGALAGALGAAAAAVCIVPLHHRTTRWAEKRFRSGLVALRQGLPLLLADLRETAAPADMADAVLARAEQGIRASYGAIVLDGTVLDARDVARETVETWLLSSALSPDGRLLEVDRTDAVFPIRVPLIASELRAAWLLLGPRPDGTFYGREERQALRDVADPIARAISVSVVRERDGRGLRDEIAGVREQIASIYNILIDHLGLQPNRFDFPGSNVQV